MTISRHIVTSFLVMLCMLVPLRQAEAQDSYTVAILPFDTNPKLVGRQ